MDMDIKINGKNFNIKDNNTNYQQYIDFKKAKFSGSYSVSDDASVTYNYAVLKNNPTIFYV